MLGERGQFSGCHGMRPLEDDPVLELPKGLVEERRSWVFLRMELDYLAFTIAHIHPSICSATIFRCIR